MKIDLNDDNCCIICKIYCKFKNNIKELKLELELVLVY